jgi:AraC-like DNA-binding protein
MYIANIACNISSLKKSAMENVINDKYSKTINEKIPRIGDELFLINHIDHADFNYPLHYHEEYELNYICNCSGIRIVGDNTSEYEDSDLVFIGTNLPHRWKKHMNESTKDACVITLQFTEELFSKYLLKTAAFNDLRIMFERSKRGLLIEGGAKMLIIKKLHKLLNQKGFKAFNTFMTIIQYMTTFKDDTRCLTTEGYSFSPTESKCTRINKVYEYTLENYSEDIRQKDVAGKIGMTDSAFSHFFKKHTNLNYSQFLINIRLGHASKLLIETSLTIAEICYMTGFRNISNFNRRFRDHYRTTPTLLRNNARTSRRENYDAEFHYDRLIKY